MKECPSCKVTEKHIEDEDFVFNCRCGFKWRETFPCPACGGEAARKKEGYYCISSGCGLNHWEPTEKDTGVSSWKKASLLKQEDSSKCPNECCDFFGQKVHTYRVADARCNPVVDTDAQKDGGKTLLKSLETKISKARYFTFYETQESRYRNTEKTLDMLRGLKGKVSEITGESNPANTKHADLIDILDKIIKQVESSSPFHQ